MEPHQLIGGLLEGENGLMYFANNREYCNLMGLTGMMILDNP